MIVHPAADVFPMLDDDELAELAEDIRANGLHHPIIRDPDGVLIDGRNRLRACELAGVEPRFATYDGDDPIGLILSENITRRHLTQGQRAMAIALLSALSQSSLRTLERQTGVSNSRIAYARVVIAEAPELADLVLAGQSLDAAYQDAKDRKLQRETREETAQRLAAALHDLRVQAPDLADLVVDEHITLGEGLAAYRERARLERESRERHTRYIIDATMSLRSLLWRSPGEILDAWVDGLSEHQERGPFAEQI